ncbi:MAG: type II secretion system GspH family protein [Deltaproteobacteria bacterium]|nr:type II secretion system GspH family protein [Deltaproteobacteria bacterium]
MTLKSENRSSTEAVAVKEHQRTSILASTTGSRPGTERVNGIRKPKGQPALRRQAQRGFTLVELIIVAILMLILAGVTLPVAKYAIKRHKEADLRLALREMRNAVDEYKRYSDAGLIPVDLGTDGYPKELEILVEGVDLVGQIDKRARFLRRIPIDPMVGTDEDWLLLSYQDEPDSGSWGGENVFDIRSSSAGTGLNGIPYAEW